MLKKLSPKEVKKLNKTFKQTREIKVICENMSYARNVASLFRIADALHVREVILTGVSHHPPFGKDLQKVSRSKERSVPWSYVQETAQAISQAKKEGYTVIAIEQASDAKVYTEVTYPQKVAFVLGSEMFGLSKVTTEACDEAVIIPMYGKGGSINVHVAFAIIGFYASLMR